MIPEADAVLRSLLHDVGAPVRFTLPAPEWDGTATVSVLLHSVVEDLDARQGNWTELRGENGRVVSRRPPLRRYVLGYLVTLWAADTLLEHALTGAVLQRLGTVDVVPDLHLTDALRATDEVVQLAVAQPGGGSAVPLWHALGIPPRPVLPVHITVSLLQETESTPTAPSDVDLGVGAPPAAPVTPPPDLPRPNRRRREGISR